MRGKRRIRLTYANVVSSLALFAALGGSSYAAITITGKQVRDGSLSGRDVRNGTLTSRDVRDRSLRARDFKRGQLPTGPQGATGARGPAGPTGPRGATGAPATRLWAVVDSAGNVHAASGLVRTGSVKAAANGTYVISFNRDVSHCARVATIGGPRIGVGETEGFIRANLVAPASLEVTTLNENGSTLEDHSFSLAVFC